MGNSFSNNQIIRWINFCIIIATMAGCTAERCDSILSANFDSDTPGTSPNLALPGDPTDDLIWYSRESGSELLVTSDHQLNYKYKQESYPQFLGFYPKRVEIDRPIYYYWIGTPHITDQPLDVYFGNGHFEAFGGIKFNTNGRVQIRGSASDNDYVDLGNFQNDKKHTVYIKYDPTARTYRVKISGGSTIDSGERPLLRTIETGLQYPTIYFYYPNSGNGTTTVASTTAYKIDLMLISKQKPSDM
jgi:hypothetical protein